MADFWDDSNHSQGVNSLVSEWKKAGSPPIPVEQALYHAVYAANELDRQNKELRKELQEEREKRENLQAQVHLLWDELFRQK